MLPQVASAESQQSTTQPRPGSQGLYLQLGDLPVQTDINAGSLPDQTMGLCDAPHDVVILCCVILWAHEERSDTCAAWMNDCAPFCEEQSMGYNLAGCSRGSAASSSAQGPCLHGRCTQCGTTSGRGRRQGGHAVVA